MGRTNEINELMENIWHVISEPGDCTRYDYIIIRDFDMYNIAPFRSTFRFPQRLDYWDIKAIHEIKDAAEKSSMLAEMADKEHCNPCTLAECIRTIMKIERE